MSKLNWDLKTHTLSIFKKFSFSFFFLVLCYIACNSQPACQSLNFRLSDKTWQFNKETKIFFPASLKQNEGFIYADNPDRGENILRTNFSPCYFGNWGNWKILLQVTWLRNEFTQLQGPKKRNKSASFRQRVLKGH